MHDTVHWDHTMCMCHTKIAVSLAISCRVEQPNDEFRQMFGIEFSAFIVAQVFLQTPIGAASDRYSRRPFILGGLLVLVPATLAQGFVVTSIGMIATRLLQGAAAAGVRPRLRTRRENRFRDDPFSVDDVVHSGFGYRPPDSRLSRELWVRFPFVFGAVLAGIGALIVYSQVEETLAQSGGKLATQRRRGRIKAIFLPGITSAQISR